MLARWLRRWRTRRSAHARAVLQRQPYENPYRHGTCAADWTKK